MGQPNINSQPNVTELKATPPPGGSSKRPFAIALGILVVGSLGGYLGYQSYYYVSTDNASAQGQATLLSSRVAGLIIKANVQENQKVKAGQVLVEIKPEDYKDVVDQAESERASVAEQVRGAEINYKRALDLVKKGASTQERLDTYETQFRSLQRRLKSADAQLSMAKLNLDYTKITAPADGKVGKKSFEVGMLAQAGQPLLGFVAGQERWVVANLKETDMSSITEGKEAFISVDAIPGHEFKGVVESVSPATGATFSLLPPDNATGNFTKVVQRVPVRIQLENLSDKDIEDLRVGLSSYVKVKVR